MRLTIVHPAIGHRRGERYLRSWQMQPLPVATLAGLTPAGVDLRFYDDRLEAIPFDEPTDAVAIPVETYTARRAYEIASEFRARGVPVVMGGFHATLLPDEVAQYAEVLVSGEAESIWPQVIDDLRHGRPQRRYHGPRTDLSALRTDRRLFAGKRYLPIGLIETGRGCRFPCEFCAVQTFFERSYRARPVDAVLAELAQIRHRNRLLFFVDDNFAGDLKSGKALLPALRDLKLRWITQMSIDAAHDEPFLEELAAAGCRGVLIGFESLDEANLALMHKRFNRMRGGYEAALANLRRHNIRVYGTFVFGYEHDTEDSFDTAVDFALAQGMYIAAFNHLTPFPGTALYERLRREGRLRYEAWWCDARYRYNELPFVPRQMTPQQVAAGCLRARRRFYSWASVLRRAPANWGDAFMFRNYFGINALHRTELERRSGFPLGDERRRDQPLLKVA